jgi:hypothetical protein
VHRFQDTGSSKSHDLDLTFQGHPRSNLVSPMETSNISFYTWLIVTMCVTCIISEIEQLVCLISLTNLNWPISLLINRISKLCEFQSYMQRPYLHLRKQSESKSIENWRRRSILVNMSIIRLISL